jgi:transcriptional regulator of heat shock response
MIANNDKSDAKASDIQAAAEIRGRKLGFLIAASTLSDDVKEELVALAAEMSPEQQDKLLDTFEAKYLDEKTASVDGELKNKLEELVKKYQAEDESAAKKLADALGQI